MTSSFTLGFPAAKKKKSNLWKFTAVVLMVVVRTIFFFFGIPSKFKDMDERIHEFQKVTDIRLPGKLAAMSIWQINTDTFIAFFNYISL